MTAAPRSAIPARAAIHGWRTISDGRSFPRSCWRTGSGRAPPPPRARNPAGTPSAARKNETVSAIAIVRASGWKKAPVTPVRRPKGRKITIVDTLEPISGGRIAFRPAMTGSCAPVSRWCAMLSATTMASSAMRPSAAAIPPRVIRLIVWPAIPRSSSTTATVSGMAETESSVRRQWRRKISRTRAARATPMKIASRTPRIDWDTNSAWS